MAGQGTDHAAISSWRSKIMNENSQARHFTGAVMVVGAGIAGTQAALDLAESGFFVYLVESSSTIGGAMAQLDKIFPTNECAM